MTNMKRMKNEKSMKARATEQHNLKKKSFIYFIQFQSYTKSCKTRREKKKKTA
jgi:hypothetical protein